MRLKVLGAYGASDAEHNLTGYLLDDWLAVDAGKRASYGEAFTLEAARCRRHRHDGPFAGRRGVQSRGAGESEDVVDGDGRHRILLGGSWRVRPRQRWLNVQHSPPGTPATLVLTDRSACGQPQPS